MVEDNLLRQAITQQKKKMSRFKISFDQVDT